MLLAAAAAVVVDVELLLGVPAEATADGVLAGVDGVVVLDEEVAAVGLRALRKMVRKPGCCAHSASKTTGSACHVMTVSSRPNRKRPYRRASLSVRLAIE